MTSQRPTAATAAGDSVSGYSRKVWASAIFALVAFWCVLSFVTFLVLRRGLPAEDTAQSELLAFSSWKFKPDLFERGRRGHAYHSVREFVLAFAQDACGVVKIAANLDYC